MEDVTAFRTGSAACGVAMTSKVIGGTATCCSTENNLQTITENWLDASPHFNTPRDFVVLPGASLMGEGFFLEPHSSAEDASPSPSSASASASAWSRMAGDWTASLGLYLSGIASSLSGGATMTSSTTTTTTTTASASELHDAASPLADALCQVRISSRRRSPAGGAPHSAGVSVSSKKDD